MKIINATWEKRNLGLDCNEIIIEKSDKLDKLEKNKKNFESQYTVVKVPMGMTDVCLYLQDNGYKFIEMLSTCIHDLKEPPLSNIEHKFVNSLSYSDMKDEDISNLFIHIKDNLFNDDRISLDPFFSKKNSSDRYMGWIEDEINNKNKIFNLIYKTNKVGFFVTKKIDNKLLFAALGGIFKKYQNSGFGLALNYHEIQCAKDLGYKKLRTAFSSNNVAASSIHYKLAYRLESQYYCFVKHR